MPRRTMCLPSLENPRFAGGRRTMVLSGRKDLLSRSRSVLPRRTNAFAAAGKAMPDYGPTRTGPWPLGPVANGGQSRQPESAATAARVRSAARVVAAAKRLSVRSLPLSRRADWPGGLADGRLAVTLPCCPRFATPGAVSEFSKNKRTPAAGLPSGP